MVTRYKNYINGRWSFPKGESFENRNPADQRDLVGVFPQSSPQVIHQAVNAAEKAFETWRLVPAPKRADILLRAGLLFEKHKERLARLMTREMGKILKETRGDVQEAIDMAYYTAGEGRRLFGQTSPSELKNKFAMTIRQPIGVCGLITPWNFPVAIPSWKVFPALVCGNTVVLKPAEDTPASAVEFVRILELAGLPKGVLNLVHGDGRTGEALVRHEKVKLISFTGSSEVGRLVAEHCGAALKRCSLEMGGKNAQIVMADADLDLAVEGALWGAFGTTGQRCTATSRVYVERRVYTKFLKRMIRRAKSIRIGNGLNSKAEMGPVINKKQLEKIHAYVQNAISQGARIECGGRLAKSPGLGRGFFYEPTIITGAHHKMQIIREEVFGPVLCSMPVKNFEEAVRFVNDTVYGLSSSIYTSNVNLAMRAVRDLETGIGYVNGPTIGAEVHLPFGGVKNTGNGHREAGTAALDIFSEWKSVYVDFSGKLQKAQMD